jgi:hypothetical protein
MDGPIIQPNVFYLTPDFYDNNHQQLLACNRLAFKDSQCPSNVYLKFTHNITGKIVFLPYQATLEAVNLLPINTAHVTWQQILGKQFVPEITDLSYLESFLNFRFKLEYIGDEFSELFGKVYPGDYTSKVKITHYVTNTKMPILVEEVVLKLKF